MIHGMFEYGAMPALERLVQFTSRRHSMIAHNIANTSTPNFRPTDLSVDSFQRALGDAIDRRRDSESPAYGPLRPHDTRELEFSAGGIKPHPRPTQGNLLFHDRNDRSLEHLMQDLAENTMTHNTAIELLNSQFRVLETAIRERM